MRYLICIIANCIFFAANALGQSLLFSDDFDGGAASGSWSEAFFTDSHYSPTTSESKFVTTPTPIAGSHAVHYFAKSGTDEINVVKLSFDFASGSEDEVFLVWYEYFATGYPWPSTSQKMARMHYLNGSFPASRKETTLVASTNNSYVDFSFACGLWGDSSSCSTDYAIGSGSPHPENSWTKWSWHVKLNTPGSADGFVKVYKNDVAYQSSTSVNLRGTDTKGFDGVWVGGNYSNGGSGLSSDGHRYIDDIRIYDGDPAVGGQPIALTCAPARMTAWRTGRIVGGR